MNLSNLFISGFYVGYIKYAPGSIASLITLIFLFFIPQIFIYQFIILLFFIIIGFMLCFNHDKKSKLKDPSYIVVDEIAGMSLSVFMLPKIIELHIIAFIIFRLLDIFKPSLINKSQKIRHGIGIMADDVISGLLTLGICWMIYLW